ncbi:MAG: O-methyltransferase [Myxococcota bacterium]
MAVRTFAHWTPRYIYDRLRTMWFERSHPELPWLTWDMIHLLDLWLQPDDRGLEWGSGRSTAWLGRRVGHLISVEHDPAWRDIVRESVDGGHLGDRITHRFADDLHRGPDADYVRVVDEVDDASLDFTLVDGHLRAHCALAVLDKLEPGGLLIIDNINWYVPRDPPSPAPDSRGPDDGYASSEWTTLHERLAGWREIWTSNGVTDTAMWVKPAGR